MPGVEAAKGARCTAADLGCRLRHKRVQHCLSAQLCSQSRDFFQLFCHLQVASWQKDQRNSSRRCLSRQSLVRRGRSGSSQHKRPSGVEFRVGGEIMAAPPAAVRGEACAESVGRASEFESEEPVTAEPRPSDGKEATQKPAPLFRFGVITDVQHADIPDGRSFFGTPRYYRHSLQVLRRAVDCWLHSQPPLAFAVHFGDIVDGFCPRDHSETAVRSVLSQFERLPVRTYHMLGNHCLYNLPRSRLNELLRIPSHPDGSSYYSFQPHPGFRFVVLDGYDISMLGWPPEHPKTAVAKALLDQHNPNANKNSPETLEGPPRRFVMFGGGVSDAQLVWLRQQLGEAQRCGEKVVVCCHLPLEPASTAPACLLWNYDVVLDLLRKHSCVVATLSGHAHRGGYALDEQGIHHRVLEAALECPEGSNAYGCIDVFADRLVLHGTDMMVGMDMPFRTAALRLGSAL